MNYMEGKNVRGYYHFPVIVAYPLHLSYKTYAGRAFHCHIERIGPGI